ncbi:MAG: glycoprotease family protein [Micavibrio sp.]|nr:glycoprotease family protein [Micavibrio sp.]
MKVLAFDTALGGCSVAVVDTDTGQATSDVQPMARGQSEELVPMIQKVVERSGFSFSDLDLVATTVGPGAFTGLRIGLSSARSFGLALDLPVDGILTTEAIATHFFDMHKNQNNELLVVIETKREDFYAQVFSSDNKAVDEAAAMPLALLVEDYQGRALNVCGDGLLRLQHDLGSNWPEKWTAFPGFDLVDPELMAVLAVQRRKAGNTRPADPVYLRGADVSVSTKPVRTIAER